MPSGPNETSAELRRAALIAALVGGYLLAMGLEPTAHKDTARDFLLARDGLAFGVYEGCEASFGHFRQGVLWVRLLAVTLALGLGPVGQHLIVSALLIVSVWVFDRSVRVHFGADLGWKPVALFLGLVILASGYPNLWNPVLAPLGVACLTAALLRVVSDGSMRAACATGASLALAAEGTLAALLVAPVVLAAAYVSGRHPIRDVVAAVGGAVVPSLAVSATTWWYNGQGLIEQPWHGVVVGAAVLLATAVAPRLRVVWRTWTVERRRRWMLASIVLAVVGQAVVASVLSRRVLFSPHYYLTTLPGLAVFAGLGFRRAAGSAMGRWASTAVAGVVLALPLSFAVVWRIGIAAGAASMPSYTMHDVERLAASFWDMGYQFRDVQPHLRGPDSVQMIAALAAFAPVPNGTARDSMADVRVVTFGEARRPGGDPPKDAREVPLGYGRRAWILPLDGWVRPAPARVCFSARGGEREAVCVDVASASIGYHGRYRDLAFPALEGVFRARMAFLSGAPSETMTTTWEIPVEIRGDDAERYVDLVGILGAPWMIERVEGVGHHGALPARQVVLDRSAAASGRLVITSHDPPWEDYLPEFMETRPGEEAIRDGVRQVSPLGRSICERFKTCPD